MRRDTRRVICSEETARDHLSGEDDIESRLSYCVKGLANAGVGAAARRKIGTPAPATRESADAGGKAEDPNTAEHGLVAVVDDLESGVGRQVVHTALAFVTRRKSWCRQSREKP
jgi:hypothetical protein